jgi:hypothetical protein
MLLENILKFFKKNGVLLLQITILLLPFFIFIEYAAMSENTDDLDVPSLEKVESVAAVQKIDKPENETKNETKLEKSAGSTFEVDEVSQEMLDKSAGNPKEMLAGSGSACTSFENVKTIAKYTGTISKAKNVEQFKKPLPAMITETEYSCVDTTGAKKTKSTTMGVGVDAKDNLLRCIQSNSDETMDSEARFKHVLKIMTHHCGFKLSEHQPALK